MHFATRVSHARFGLDQHLGDLFEPLTRWVADLVESVAMDEANQKLRNVLNQGGISDPKTGLERKLGQPCKKAIKRYLRTLWIHVAGPPGPGANRLAPGANRILGSGGC